MKRVTWSSPGVRLAVTTLCTYLAGDAIPEAAPLADYIKLEGATVEKRNDLQLSRLGFLEKA
jgi:hypothetical protein